MYSISVKVDDASIGVISIKEENNDVIKSLHSNSTVSLVVPVIQLSVKVWGTGTLINVELKKKRYQYLI